MPGQYISRAEIKVRGTLIAAKYGSERAKQKQTMLVIT